MNMPTKVSYEWLSATADEVNARAHLSFLIPNTHVHRDVLEFYWQSLVYHDTLKYRLSDYENPTWSDVVAMLVRKDLVTFTVLVPAPEENAAPYPVGECALEGFTGKAAVIHFSTHPANSYKTNRTVMDRSLEQIAALKTLEGDPYLTTLVGLTPAPNRAARLMNAKAGFKTQCIIPNGARYLGEVTDAVMTTRVING